MEGTPWAALEKLIREVITELLEMAVTPHVRELRAKAVTYGRVIHNWQTYSPTAPQVQAMQECVEELNDKVRAAKREVSRVSRKPSAPDRRSVPVASGAPGASWHAESKDATGIHPRSASPAQGAPPIERGERIDRGNAPTTRPPVSGGEPAISVPPLSTPRSIDTPTPALLRSRRSR